MRCFARRRGRLNTSHPSVVGKRPRPAPHSSLGNAGARFGWIPLAVQRYRVFMGTNTLTTTTLRYFAIPEDVAREARETLRDRFGHRLRVETAQAPCRVCLRIPTAPEEMILLSYQPLPDTGPYAEIGPIFVHADPCRPYADVCAFPPDFAPRPLILRAYGHDGRIARAVVAPPGEAPEHAAALLSDNAIAEVHARHVSYTCFDFKIVRAS